MSEPFEMMPIYSGDAQIGAIDPIIVESIVVVCEDSKYYIVGCKVIDGPVIDGYNRWYLTPPFKKEEKQDNLEEIIGVLELNHNLVKRNSSVPQLKTCFVCNKSLNDFYLTNKQGLTYCTGCY